MWAPLLRITCKWSIEKENKPGWDEIDKRVTAASAALLCIDPQFYRSLAMDFLGKAVVEQNRTEEHVDRQGVVHGGRMGEGWFNVKPRQSLPGLF